MRQPIIRGQTLEDWTELRRRRRRRRRRLPFDENARFSLLFVWTLSPLLSVPSLWLISHHSHRLIFSEARRPRPPPHLGPGQSWLHAGAVMLPLAVHRHRFPAAPATAGPRNRQTTALPRSARKKTSCLHDTSANGGG